MSDHASLVSTADIEVHRVLSEADLAAAGVLLDGQELALGVPLVDEGERHRLLEAAASGAVASDGLWRPVVAKRGDEVVGYAAVVVTAAPGGVAVGDVAPSRVPGAWAGIVPALLSGLEAVVGSDAVGLQLWVRSVAVGDLAPAVAAGYRVERRLGVLGRGLGAADVASTPPEGFELRGYVPDGDDAAVVDLLAAAYEGTGDGGWDLARFHRRRQLPWFAPDDLLVASDVDGRLVGLHWLKRRDAVTGEVYNLAVHPEAQGRGVGPALLDAGLAHLRKIGCLEVILWVDRANERAVALYTSRGFETRWDDVALDRALGSPTSTP